jgi:hypothetical protein
MSSFGTPQKLRQERLGHADGSPVTESVYTQVYFFSKKPEEYTLGNRYYNYEIGTASENFLTRKLSRRLRNWLISGVRNLVEQEMHYSFRNMSRKTMSPI